METPRPGSPLAQIEFPDVDEVKLSKSTSSFSLFGKTFDQ